MSVTEFCEQDLTGALRAREPARMRPADTDVFGEAWAILERLWEGAVARARTLPEAALHRSFDNEWSLEKEN